MTEPKWQKDGEDRVKVFGGAKFKVSQSYLGDWFFEILAGQDWVMAGAPFGERTQAMRAANRMIKKLREGLL